MTKTEFIIELINTEVNGIYNSRWYRPSSFSDGSINNDYWLYSKPGVDCIQPEIMLKNDGVVEFTNFDESDVPLLFGYQEFIDKYPELV